MSYQFYVYYVRWHKWGVAHEMGEEIIAQSEKEAEKVCRERNGNIQQVYTSLLGFARAATKGEFWVMGEVKTVIPLSIGAMEDLYKQWLDVPF